MIDGVKYISLILQTKASKLPSAGVFSLSENKIQTHRMRESRVDDAQMIMISIIQTQTQSVVFFSSQDTSMGCVEIFDSEGNLAIIPENRTNSTSEEGLFAHQIAHLTDFGAAQYRSGQTSPDVNGYLEQIIQDKKRGEVLSDMQSYIAQFPPIRLMRTA
jgi:hypothetical protein